MADNLNPVDIIRAKRDGHRLTRKQIDWFIGRYAADDGVAEEQAAAMAMAIFFQGLDNDELLDWTNAMIASGSRLDLNSIKRPKVDKHSTGGVGDKISLVLVPLVAACGAAVPQLSGRGLGHTGGTLDKMESIPGWKADVTMAELRSKLEYIGGVITGASADLAPADRKLYALRDITATVESIPLIASSIMSKKIAEGTDALVLDVKTGSGAFMSDPFQARRLAQAMVDIGQAHGVRTRALVTSMDNLLGMTAGNSLEVQESLDVLAGTGPADVRELTLALANEMLALVGITKDPASVLDSGQALEVFHRMVRAQGGTLEHGLPSATHRSFIRATRPGFIVALEARAIGVAAWQLGAGRAQSDDPVSATAGVRSLVTVGQRVAAGDQLLELHADNRDRLEMAHVMAEQAIQIADSPIDHPRLILERIT
ncbi:MAG: thymidine phosphorylase [Acidimicrobiales bacterium]|jgi:thymidine phosphorylase